MLDFFGENENGIVASITDSAIPFIDRLKLSPDIAGEPTLSKPPESRGIGMDDTNEHNRRAWNALARRRSEFARPASREDFDNPRRVINPFGWLTEPFAGQRVLCLAAGGGRHGPLFALQGADTIVVDLSEEMLRADEEMVRNQDVRLQTIKASMCDLGMLTEASFDIVLQPVSSCYVENVRTVYREVARVTKSGGVYISQHKQPISLQAGAAPLNHGGYAIEEPYYRSGPLPPVTHPTQHRELGTREYLHRLEELLGGLCAQGFAIEDVREPKHADPTAPWGHFRQRSRFVPPYLVIKAVRKRNDANPPRLWTPNQSGG